MNFKVRAAGLDSPNLQMDPLPGAFDKLTADSLFS